LRRARRCEDRGRYGPWCSASLACRMPEMRARGCHREAAAAKERLGRRATSGPAGPDRGERRPREGQKGDMRRARRIRSAPQAWSPPSPGGGLSSSGSPPPRGFRDDAA
jgi:hypothetical protein